MAYINSSILEHRVADCVCACVFFFLVRGLVERMKEEEKERRRKREKM